MEYAIDYISGNNFGQRDFIDAINELHYRIDNLNI